MTDTQIRIIRALQDGIDLCERPFDEIARQVGVPVADLLDQIRQWQSDGTIRRFGAILRHHRAGYEANAMVVWNVPENQIDDFAAIATSVKNVSHCYQRPAFAGFEYNLYTMIHGRSRDDCEAAALGMSKLSGINDYKMLYTTAEFKKTSPVYFAE